MTTVVQYFDIDKKDNYELDDWVRLQAGALLSKDMLDWLGGMGA